MEIKDRNFTKSMARNLADWMRASLVPFGVTAIDDGALWWRAPGGSGIYLGALNIDQHATSADFVADLQKVTNVWGDEKFGLYDCWGRYDLAAAGFERSVQNPWFLRSAGELSGDSYQLPTGIIVERVETIGGLDEFERASWLGFNDQIELPADYQSFSMHSPGTLDHPNMHYLVARLGATVVAGVIAHATEDMLGIFGLSTLIDHRRKGYATALIRAAVALRPDLPVAVFPDPPSVPIYTQIGFAPAGEIAIWWRS